jgi:hypothetical protein
MDLTLDMLALKCLRGFTIKMEAYLYETVIGTEGAWDEMNNALKNIEFTGDDIRISHFFGRTYVINVPQTRFTSLNPRPQWRGFQLAPSDKN